MIITHRRGSSIIVRAANMSSLKERNIVCINSYFGWTLEARPMNNGAIRWALNYMNIWIRRSPHARYHNQTFSFESVAHFNHFVSLWGPSLFHFWFYYFHGMCSTLGVFFKLSIQLLIHFFFWAAGRKYSFMFSVQSRLKWKGFVPWCNVPKCQQTQKKWIGHSNWVLSHNALSKIDEWKSNPLLP